MSLVPDWAAPPAPWACHPDPEWPGNKERAACLVMAYRDTKERSAQKTSETQDEAEMGAVATWALELKGGSESLHKFNYYQLDIGQVT